MHRWPPVTCPDHSYENVYRTFKESKLTMWKRVATEANTTVGATVRQDARRRLTRTEALGCPVAPQLRDAHFAKLRQRRASRGVTGTPV
jgi:hypothetical protein